MAKSSRYAPRTLPTSFTGANRQTVEKLKHGKQEDRATFWRTHSSKPPLEPVSPALRALRRRWYAQNPWRPDWQAHWEALRGARACFLERGTA